MINENEIEFWNKTTELLKKYLSDNNNPDTNVINYESGKSLSKIINLDSNKPHSEIEILGEIEKYLHYSARTTHPQFNNQLYAGYNFYALVGELISFITNTSMATYEISPVATLMEKKLVDELNNKLGFQNGDGIMVTGGSNANLMAIHCARNKRFPETKERGNPKNEICVFVSKDAHYSFKKAIILLGLGTENLILVDTNKKGEIIPEDLEQKILQARSDGKIPLMVASTAGSTVLGSFDPIDKIDIIAKKYKLWHHVDGAWGGVVLFSEKHKEKIKGIEKADSFTFDAHKLLGTGLITSFFLTKDKGELLKANSGGGSKYLFHEYENSEFDYGPSSLQCGRKVDSLKFWLYWKSLGDKGISNFLDEQIEKAQYLKKLLSENPNFKLINEPDYLNVCFQILPNQNVDINEYNYKFRFHILKQGKVMLNFSRFDDGTIFFRFVFANNMTTKNDLEKLISYLVEESKKYSI